MGGAARATVARTVAAGIFPGQPVVALRAGKPGGGDGEVLLQMAQLCIDNKKIEPYEGLTLMTDYVNASLARKILQNRQD